MKKGEPKLSHAARFKSGGNIIISADAYSITLPKLSN
jgi:hypothetical protein